MTDSLRMTGSNRGAASPERMRPQGRATHQNGILTIWQTRGVSQSGKGGGGMKRRENLLRLKRFRAEELSRRSATLETMSAEVERKLADLEEAVAREKQRANASDIGRLAFPSFLRAMDARRDNLKATLKDIGREQALATIELDKAGEELRAIEVVAEQELRRAADSHLRRNRMRLDELALSRQLRKQALRQI